MTQDLAHLLEDVRAVAQLAIPVRIEYIKKDRWVNYDRAESILRRMDDLVSRPRTIRMPGMLLVGRSDNGKTHILERFMSSHPGCENLDGPNIKAKVILVQAPPGPDEIAFHDSILNMLRIPTPRNRRAADKRDDVIKLLREIELKVLAIDEIHNILSGSAQRQRTFLNLLKYLSNELKVAIIASGTEDALRAIQTDRQIASRLPPEPLPLWKYGADYRRLLASFEQMLPLRERSNIQAPELARIVFNRAGVTIGRTSELLNSAAIWALNNGHEKIDDKAILDCDFVSDSKRKEDLANL